MKEDGLTRIEKEIADLTVCLWNSWCALPNRMADDDERVRLAIHRIQQELALRIVRRDYPECWRHD